MIPPAPHLLVSVRDSCEAIEALAGGADWIDLKEPRRGALGAVDVATARRACAAVADRAPISAAAGELLDWPRAAARELLNVPAVSLIKLGLAGCQRFDWLAPWREVQSAVAAAGRQLAGVIYADRLAAESPSADEILAAVSEFGCRWVLWDTFDKASGPLDSHAPIDALASQFAAARTMGIAVVVAGRLDEVGLARLPLELVDMVAVRGAVCRGSRDGAVCRDRVARLKQSMERHVACSTG